MWVEYRIPANFQRQKEIIRQLRKWIVNLEEKGLIEGFAFNHYTNLPNEPDTLRIRFNYQNEENQELVENVFEDEVRQLVQDYHLQIRNWPGDEEVLKAYEFGARCAFLYWDLVDNRKFPENYISNFLLPNGQLSQIPHHFQQNFNHGVMNSLGIPKYPQEQIIHLVALMESTQSMNYRELCDRLKRDPFLSQIRLERR